MKESDLVQYRNPDFSWKDKVVYWLSTREPGGEYQKGIISSIRYSIHNRLQQDQYVPVVTEGIGICRIGMGSVFLTTGLCFKVHLWFLGVKSQEEILYVPKVTIGIGKDLIVSGINNTLRLPLVSFQTLRQLL